MAPAATPIRSAGAPVSTRRWPFGQQQAIRALRDLLSHPRYKMQWLPYARRAPRNGEINCLAVARFLIEQGAWGTEATVEQIKDTVYRALSLDPRRQWLTPGTLTRFVDGFRINDEAATRLRAALAGVGSDAAQPV